MNSSIVSVVLLIPGLPIKQAYFARIMQKAQQLGELESWRLLFFTRKSGIETGNRTLLDLKRNDPYDFTFSSANQELKPHPRTKSRMARGLCEVPELSAQRASKSIDQATTNAGEITHLFWVSCAEIGAQGVELELMSLLGIAEFTEALCIHFMGCAAAFTGIKLSDNIVKAELEAAETMVSVELCTLHFRKEYVEDNILANSLFGDGAAAALMRNSNKGLKIQQSYSQWVPGGEQEDAAGIGDFGFEMKLSNRFEALLDGGIQHLKELFEVQQGRSSNAKDAIHPGGNKYFLKVQAAFGCPEVGNFHAVEVLKNFGNMSLAKTHFVFAKMLHDPLVNGDILSLGFGPGLTLEALHLEK
uniref:Type III polyketide synthase n=1 Tax=uncultured organism TaxID=155900 RepID=A0A8A2HDI5_9ZZZZ|nr:type III polyketide synthase [uncultured organism]